jgi:hypothetical protein
MVFRGVGVGITHPNTLTYSYSRSRYAGLKLVQFVFTTPFSLKTIQTLGVRQTSLKGVSESISRMLQLT